MKTFKEWIDEITIHYSTYKNLLYLKLAKLNNINVINTIRNNRR